MLVCMNVVGGSLQLLFFKYAIIIIIIVVCNSFNLSRRRPSIFEWIGECLSVSEIDRCGLVKLLMVAATQIQGVWGGVYLRGLWPSSFFRDFLDIKSCWDSLVFADPASSFSFSSSPDHLIHVKSVLILDHFLDLSVRSPRRLLDRVAVDGGRPDGRREPGQPRRRRGEPGRGR